MATYIKKSKILRKIVPSFYQGKIKQQSTNVNPNTKDVPFATYRIMTEATKEDMKNSMLHFSQDTTPQKRADSLLAMLESQRGMQAGHMLDLYQHNLQSGTRALRDGADAETVVCALFHDVGEMITPTCHGEIAASILRPFISDKNYWILQHHEIFQAYYYGKAAGVDSDLRDAFKAHEHFAACEQFCRDWDQTAFDPTYENLPLATFEPLVVEVLGRRPYTQPGHGMHDINMAKAKLGMYDGDLWM